MTTKGHSKRKSPVGGPKAVAEMLKHLDAPSREKLLSNVAARDPKIAKEIKKELFVFEDLAPLDTLSWQTLLKEIPNPILILAMRTASAAMAEAIFANLSERARKLLQDELDAQGPRRRGDVEAAQEQIVQLAKKLETAGKITLR